MDVYDTNIDHAALAALVIDGHLLNPNPRPIEEWDQASVFVDGAPCRFTPLEAARTARAVLSSVSRAAVVAAAKTWYGPRGKHTTTTVSDLEVANCRVRMAGPLLAFASGKAEAILPGKFGVTKDADAQVAVAIARADRIIAALQG